MESGIKENLVRLCKSLIVSYVVSAVLLLVSAAVLYSLRLNQNQMLVCVLVIYALSNLVGGFVLSRMVKGRRLLNGMVQGLSYCVVLLGVSWLVNKGLHTEAAAVLRAVAACVAGGIVGGIIG
jgi:putative membrane protein (TIGR04086 family)